VAFPDVSGPWARTLADAKTAGHTYVTVPWIDEKIRNSADDYRRVADLFNRAAEKAKEAGLRFAYHNHDFEFRTVDGAVPFDILLERTQRGLVDFEMDLYWVVKGGQDPIAYFNKYPGRFAMVHVKDATAAPERTIADVGKGTIDFRQIFAHDAAHGAHIKHFFVEHDNPADPWASIKASHDYLAQLDY
jgi:sugar phosphate isomerase/epimerase